MARRLTAVAEQEGVGLTYGFQVPTGSYNFGIEAREDGPESLARPAARTRDTLAVPGFSEGGLSVSDLLLADGLRTLADRPTRREELRLWPSRTLHFTSGDPVHVYFEVYGLATDDEGVANYRVQFSVEDAEHQNFVERVVSGFVELFQRGDEQQPTVAWERVVEVSGDRVIEYVSVTLPHLDAGQYVVSVVITDVATGETTQTERLLWVDQPTT